MTDTWTDPPDRVLEERITPNIWNTNIAANLRLLGGHSHTGVPGDGTLLLPTQIAPSYFIPTYEDTVQGTPAIVGVANQVRCLRFYLPFKLTVNALSFYVSTLQAGSTAGVGIYNSTGTVLLASGTASSASTGVKRVAVTPLTLDAGFYLLAWTNTGTVAQGISFGPISATYTTLLNDTNSQLGNAANPSAVGVLPATTGVISAASIALLAVKIEG